MNNIYQNECTYYTYLDYLSQIDNILQISSQDLQTSYILLPTLKEHHSWLIYKKSLRKYIILYTYLWNKT